MEENKLEAVIENGVPLVKITCGQCGQVRIKANPIIQSTDCRPVWQIELPGPGQPPPEPE